MSALTASRRAPRGRRILTAGLVAAAAVLGGLLLGRLATAHAGTTVLEAGGAVVAILIGAATVARRPGLVVAGAVLVLAFLPSYDAPGAFSLVLNPALLLFAFLAVALPLATYMHRRTSMSAIDICVTLMVLGMVLDTIFGPRNVRDVADDLWLWLPPYFAGRVIAVRPALANRLVVAVVAAAVALTPFSIAEALGLGSPFFSPGINTASVFDEPHLRGGEAFRVQASFGHPIAFSMFLAVALVFAVALSATTSGRRRWLALAAVPAIALCEALTLSRTGLVVAAVALVALATGRVRHGAGRAARRAVTVMAIALVAVVVTVPGVAAVPLSILGLQTDTSTSAELQRSASYRTGLYTAALRAHVISPFGNATSKLANEVEADNSSVDSAYLAIVDAYGLAVTIPVLGIVLCLAVGSLVSGPEEDGWGRTYRACGLGLAAGLTTVALITQQEYFVWLVFGLAAAPLRAQRLVSVRDAASRWRYAAEPDPPAHAPTLGDRMGIALRRLWWVPPLGALVGVALAVAIPRLASRPYQAAATVSFDVPNFSEVLFGGAASYVGQSNAVTASRAAGTDASLLTQPALATQTARALGHGMTASQVRRLVQVSEVGTSDVWTVQASADTPALATELANAYANAAHAWFVARARQADIAGAEQLDRSLVALSPRKRSGPQGQALQAEIDQLIEVYALDNGGLQTVDRATAAKLVSATPARKALEYAAFAGLVGGLLLVGRIARATASVGDLGQIEDALEAPVLATFTVPPRRRRRRRRRRSAELDEAIARADAEAAARLRTTWHVVAGDRPESVLVVGTDAGDRTGRVASALAFAEGTNDAARILVIDADLRHPAVTPELGLTRSPGLTEVLTGEQPLAACLREVPIPAAFDAEIARGRTISVLPAGVPVQNSPGVLESAAMGRLLDELRAQFDLLILAAPPLGEVADGRILADAVAGVLLVLAPERLRAERLSRLHDDLGALRSPVFGIVAVTPAEGPIRRRTQALAARLDPAIATS